MAESLFIKKDNTLPPAENYDFLRKAGIKLIEELSGKVWTDYNTHDPGITLLEAICYTLTDLGYRTSFEIKDLLATGKGRLASWENIFYTARQILPCNPVTLNDYRKMIIDTEGVRNAWIEVSDDYEIPMYLESKEKKAEGQGETKYTLSYDVEGSDEVLHLRGLYKVFVEYENDILVNKKEEVIAQKIKDKLHLHRNLCEDFLSVTSIEYEVFKMEADIQVNEGTDIEQVNARVYKVIQDFFSPPVIFYSLEQMVAKGCSAEEIFEGPVLKSGFINTGEMEASERFRDIHLSDIIRLILEINGVIAVKQITLSPDPRSSAFGFSEWVNDLKDVQKAPRLDIENSIITFSRSGDRHRYGGITDRRADKERVKDILKFLQSADVRSKVKGTTSKDFNISPGEFMNVADYYPVQNMLPAIYGMAENYLDEEAGDFSIREFINELLDEKVGTHVRKIINALYDERTDKTPVEKIINTVLYETTDEALKLLNDLIEDEENERLIERVISELPGGRKKEKSLKKIINEFFENKSGYYVQVSHRTKALKALAFQKYGLHLTAVKKEEDINNLRNEYKKIQIDQLDKRKKQTLQLRGFLMVFEQILSDYLSQLSHIRELFSFDSQLGQTYFPEPLEGIKNMESLFIDFKKYKASLLKLTETEAGFTKRRDNILDHLLGRFAESFDKYAFFIQSYAGKAAGKKLIDDKIAFLSDYIEISNYRGKGFNYSKAENSWNTSNVAGLKKRIFRLLGLKDYNRKSIASHAIFIEKISVNAGITRYVVVLVDPAEKDFVLLRSVEYEFEGEAHETLNYIIENGTNLNLYQKEGRKEKWGYQLKKATQENDSEIIATSIFFGSNDQAEFAFTKTIETLTSFSEDENFHLLEHILLRPKITPREKAARRSAILDADTVNLLPVHDVSYREESTGKKKEVSSYKFKITNRRDPVKKDRLIWELSLLDKNDNEVLIVKEDFVYYKHLTRRIEQIRQFASDNSNYNPVNIEDDYVIYSINDGQRQLAVSSRSFHNPDEMKEMDAEIANIIKFFSYEEDLSVGQHGNFDDVSYYADPYSLRISIFIPTWPQKFRDPTFRHLLEKTIYLETPSHIYPAVYWLDHRQMWKFEGAYKLWLEEMSAAEIPNTEVVNNFIAVLNESRK